MKNQAKPATKPVSNQQEAEARQALHQRPPNSLIAKQLLQRRRSFARGKGATILRLIAR